MASMPSEPIRILIVEDESAHAEVVCRALKTSGLNISIQLGASLRDYRLMLAVETPHIALLDLNLTDGRAMEVLTAPAVAGAFPVLIMTSFGNEKMAVEAMKAGALDYIVKSPETFAEMPKIIERTLREWNALKEHQRIGEALRQSEEKYRLLAENTEAILWDFDLAADRWLYISPYVTKLLGYRPEEWTDLQSWGGRIHPEDRSWATSYCAEMTGRGKAHSFEYRFLKKDGSIVWLRDVCSVKMEGCRPVRLQGVMIDITEQKQAEETLRESEHYLKTILQTTAEGFWIVDSRGQLTDVNEAYCRLSGYSRNEILTLTISDLDAVETPSETAQRIQQIITTGSNIFESRHRKKDGSIFDVEMSVTYLPAADGGRLICFCRDMTEKIKLREEADRNNRLVAVGELSAGIAHEINNPAGLILSNLATISEAFDDITPILDDHYRRTGDFPFGGLPFSRLREQFPEILQETGDSARRIRQIVEDLKNFAQGSSSRDLDDFSLNEAVQRSLRLTATLWRQATQSFTLDLTEEVIMIHGCERRVEQILVNLIANACQALPDRNCGITLSTRYDDEKCKALIVLRDEGVGIPNEHLVRLATPFFTTRQGVGGTGLGLSVSFGIIKEHGGTIHFASKPGAGTTVTIALPATLRADVL